MDRDLQNLQTRPLCDITGSLGDVLSDVSLLSGTGDSWAAGQRSEPRVKLMKWWWKTLLRDISVETVLRGLGALLVSVSVWTSPSDSIKYSYLTLAEPHLSLNVSDKIP